jgi:hypothetical protein
MTEDPAPSEVKGYWFTTARRYVLQNFGQEAVDAVAAHMGTVYGPLLASALHSEWYPEESLRSMLAALDVVIAKHDPGQYVRVIEEASLVGIHHFFRALLRLVPPGTMLRKIPTMWSILRRGAGRVVVETDDTGGVVRYSLFPYFDDPLYRLMTKGAIQSLMTLCGTRHARVELGTHTRDSLVVDVRWA